MNFKLICFVSAGALSGCLAKQQADVSHTRAGDGGMAVVATMKPEGCQLGHVAVHPRNRDFGITTSDAKVEAWNLVTHNSLWRQSSVVPWGFNYYPESLWALDFPPDNKTVIVGGTNGMVMLSLEDGSTQRTFKLPLPAGKHPFYTAVSTSADGRFMVSSHLVNTQPKPIQPQVIGVSPTLLADARKQYNQTLTLWNRETGAVVRSVNLSDSAIRAARFSPDGAHMYTVSYTHVRFFKVETGQEIVTFDAEAIAAPTNSTGIFAATAVSPDLRFVAVSMLDNIAIFSTESRAMIANFQQLGSGFMGLARTIGFSNNLCCLEAADLNGNFYSWRIADGKSVYFGQSPQISGVIGSFFEGPGAWPFGQVSYDPERKFVLEVAPSQMGEPCKSIRLVQMPALHPEEPAP